MPSQKPLSRGELVARTGMTADIMTFWFRHGLIRPIGERTGKGRHLQFAYTEANIAAIMLQLREFGSHIDVMMAVANIYRDAISWAEENRLSWIQALALSQYVNVLMSNGGVTLEGATLEDHMKLNADLRAFEKSDLGTHFDDRLREIAKREKFTGIWTRCEAFIEIAMQPIRLEPTPPTHFWRTPAGWKRHQVQAGQFFARKDGVFSSIAIDVFAILHAVWADPLSDGIITAADLKPAR